MTTRSSTEGKIAMSNRMYVHFEMDTIDYVTLCAAAMTTDKPLRVLSYAGEDVWTLHTLKIVADGMVCEATRVQHPVPGESSDPYILSYGIDHGPGIDEPPCFPSSS